MVPAHSIRRALREGPLVVSCASRCCSPLPHCSEKLACEAHLIDCPHAIRGNLSFPSQDSAAIDVSGWILTAADPSESYSACSHLLLSGSCLSDWAHKEGLDSSETHHALAADTAAANDGRGEACA